MTREEAKREIDSLDYYLQNHTGDYGEESHTAMMMAIKALEQEPREITLEDVKEYCKPRCLTIITNELLYELTHPKIKALEQEPILDKIRAEIEPKCDRINSLASVLPYAAHREIQELLCEIMDLCDAESEYKRTIDADELLKRIAKKCKTPSLSEDTVNGLCGATAIIYDMLIESGQEKDADKEVDNADSN